MAYYFSPIGNTQIIDVNGNPLVGGTISTFLAGTSTAATTYTDDTGGTAQGVVMTLNSLGLPTNGPVWLLGGVPLKFIIKNAAGVTQSTFDDVSGIGDTSSAPDQWVLYGAAPTYISATSFSVAGDQTNTFHVGRRVKTVNSGGTVYGTITATAYTTLTTVTVSNDSVSLDSGLSAVNYGLLSATNPSVPSTYAKSGPNNDITSLTGLTSSLIYSGTKQATTSGTSKEFLNIPAWARRITISLSGVSTNGTSEPVIQIGDSGGYETSGYLGSSCRLEGAVAVGIINFTAGIGIYSGSAANVLHGSIVLTLLDPATNLWAASGTIGLSSSVTMILTASSKALSATLDRLRITTLAGVDTFDAGSINILYE